MFEFEKKKLKNYLDKRIYNLLKSYDAIIAGGAVTSLFTRKEINDIDVYFRSRKDMAEFVDEAIEQSHWVMSYTNKAVLFICGGNEYQVITFRAFDKPEDIFETFDFTVCMGAFDFKTEEFVLHPEFMQHNAQKLLKFNQKTAFPIISAMRVQKYENRGYYISKPDYIKIILACMNLNIENKEQLEDQLGGMYGYNMDKLLKDVDEFSLDVVMEKISEIEVSDDYFNMPKLVKDFRVEDISIEILGIENFTFIECEDESRHIVRSKSRIETWEKDIPETAKVVKSTEFMKDHSVYKFVKLYKDGKMTSFYDTDFVYEFGEVAIPNSKRGHYSGNRLYVGDLENTEYMTYSEKDDAVLIEMKIGSFEDVYDYKVDGTFEVKKATPIRIVTASEYKQYISDRKRQKREKIESSNSALKELKDMFDDVY